MTRNVFIIAEAGVNHNGDMALAYRLIDAAYKAGADAVKFQTFKTERIVTRHVHMAEYQKDNAPEETSQFEMLKSLELTYKDFRNLQKYCDDIGIQFLSTPDEEESLDFLADELELPWIKIGSGEINNYALLRRAASKQRNIILSTGMSTLDEVAVAVNIIRETSRQELIVLHCTTNYPCPMNEVNLNAMLTIRDTFKVNVGYSDHTLGTEVSIAAVALGAQVIEKHFTLDKGMRGPDHKASLDPVELKMMVDAIRNVERALGDGVKIPSVSEESTKQVVRKRIVAGKRLNAGVILKENDFVFKRANIGIFAENLERVCGRTLHVAVEADQPIQWSDLLGVSSG